MSQTNQSTQPVKYYGILDKAVGKIRVGLVNTNCETLVKEVAQELAFDYPEPEVMKYVPEDGNMDLADGLIILRYFQTAVIQLTPTLYNEIKDLSGSAVFSNDHFFYQGNVKETTTETYFKKCQQPDSKWYYELTPVDWVFQLLYPNNLNDLVNVVDQYDY